MKDKKELSLFDLTEKIFSSLKNIAISIFDFSVRSIFLSVKYFWIVVPITAGLFVASWVLTSQRHTTYSAKSVITFSKDIRLMVENEFMNLNSMFGVDSLKFYKSLNITREQAYKFIDFRTTNVINILNDSLINIAVQENSPEQFADTTNRIVPNALGLTIRLKGSSNYYPYMRGIVEYFNNCKPIVKADSIAKALTRQKIEFCDTELERLARLSEFDYFDKKRQNLKYNANGMIVLEPSRKHLYYLSMRDLLKEKEFLEKEYNNSSNVINFYSENMRIETIPRNAVLTTSLIAGWLLSLIVIHVLKNRKKYKV